MEYGDFKGLKKRTASDKILHDKAFCITKNAKYDGYQRGTATMVYNLFNKKASDSGIESKNMSDKQLAKEIHKPIIRKLNKKSKFVFIWGAYLAEMQLIRKLSKGICLGYWYFQ